MSTFNADPDNPVSGDMPADTLEGSDTVFGATDQGDSLADNADLAADGLTDEGGASEAVRDPSMFEPAPSEGLDDSASGGEPVNDIGGVGSTSATLSDNEE